VEIELQYLYAADGAELVPIELAGFALAESTSFQILDTYYDSDALALRRAGCSLRIRQAHNVARPGLVWKGVATRRADGAKQRDETEIPLDEVPSNGVELARLVGRFHLWEAIAAAAGINADAPLHAIGELRNHRSSHMYVQGLHRLELTWDRLVYPVGPPQTRVEVEARTEAEARFLERVDAELQELFSGRLTPATQGKSRELCERLYPDLLDAA
jgi:hypothetical protein